MNVAVNRLTLRGACDAPHHDAFLIEDALNTQISSEKRLVLVRTLNLLPTGGQDCTSYDCRHMVASRVATSWARTLAGACHGGSDSAAGANSVWFHDLAEAKAILLSRLARGQSVDGWYWKLAVNLWRCQPLAQWVADELAADPPDAQANGSIMLLHRLLAQNRIETVEEAIKLYLQRQSGNELPVFRGANHRHQDGQRMSGSNDPAEMVSAPSPVTDRLKPDSLARLQSALPTNLLIILQRLYRQPSGRTALVSLTTRLIVTASPELRLHPQMLQNAAQQILDGSLSSPLQKRLTEPPSKQPVSAVMPSMARRTKSLAGAKMRVPQINRNSVETPAIASLPIDNEPGAWPSRETQSDAASPGTMPTEQRSAAAGLFYIVNILRILDWPGWLSHRPELLACQPTAQLLRHAARHHRANPRDPVFAFLDERLCDQPPVDAESLGFWRQAVDKWLRRRLRMNIASLIKRQGWMQWQDDQLAVRFPLQGIDMRLRRMALDRDPGWVDWAGLSIRFHFGDRSDTGGNFP